MNLIMTVILFTMVNAKATTKTHESEYEIFSERFTEKTITRSLSENDKQSYIKLVEQIGRVSRPHSQMTHQKKANDQLIFETQYTIGDYGLRIIPDSFLNTMAPEHLIIAGDSNVFSEGVADSDSITACLSRDLKKFHAYNFGQRGGGPHNTLALMENYPFEQLIKEPKGVFLYNYFTFYMPERVIGSKNYIAWDGGFSPYYKLDSHGKLIRDGQFNDRFLITSLFKFIAHNQWLNKILPILPQINEKHIELVAQIFVKMKSEYLKKFPAGKFMVIINDSYLGERTEPTKWLIQKLTKNSIQLLEIGFQPDLQKGMVFRDQHFNSAGQKDQSKIISEKLLKIISSSSQSSF